MFLLVTTRVNLEVREGGREADRAEVEPEPVQEPYQPGRLA